MCATDEEGRVKPGMNYQVMQRDQAAAHVRGADHQRRLAEGRAVPGPVLVPVMGVVRHVVLCLHCSLTEHGYRRAKHHRLDGPTALCTWELMPTPAESRMGAGPSTTTFTRLELRA